MLTSEPCKKNPSEEFRGAFCEDLKKEHEQMKDSEGHMFLERPSICSMLRQRMGATVQTG